MGLLFSIIVFLLIVFPSQIARLLVYPVSKMISWVTTSEKITLTPLEQAIELLIEHGRIHKGENAGWNYFSVNNKTVTYQDSDHYASMKYYVDNNFIYETINPNLKAKARLRLKNEQQLKEKQLAADLLRDLAK